MYLEPHEDGVIIRVKVTPNSSKNQITGERDDRLTVKLTSPPVEGKANKQLLKFIGKKLGAPSSSITILRGQSSREKVLLVPGIDERTAMERLK